MRRPWSISTTVRNPNRLREFLRVLSTLENKEFNEQNQVLYQVLLIKNRLYEPNRIPQKYKHYYTNPVQEMPLNVAKEIFEYQDYEDPPMRGRQSANPLNKLGFAVARQGYGLVRITPLGRLFLSENVDIGDVFFRSLLKLQFPNPWSNRFTAGSGFNIRPFLAVGHLMMRINESGTRTGMNREEFCIFIPTFIDGSRLSEQAQTILDYRSCGAKDDFVREYLIRFYGTKTLTRQQVNDLYDYGDNIMRYFRLTRYFKVSAMESPLGWSFDIEPTRRTEMDQLLATYDGTAVTFPNLHEYLDYLSDFNRPMLPWEDLDNLAEVAASILNSVTSLVLLSGYSLHPSENRLLTTQLKALDIREMTRYLSELRALNVKLKQLLAEKELKCNVLRLRQIVGVLRAQKELKRYSPEQFEKLVLESLKIINDEMTIKPNYPVDDDGEPISHAPGNKPDIECYYASFKAICEVTLNSGRLQWVLEGQPVMRHLREFEEANIADKVICVFIAPRIHNDTYSTFWTAVKYEYNGSPQRIVPLSTYQYADFLEGLCELMDRGCIVTHLRFLELLEKACEVRSVRSFSEWQRHIENQLHEFRNCLWGKPGLPLTPNE